MKKALALLLTLMLVGTSLSALAVDGPAISVFYGGGTPQTLDPALNSAANGSNTIRLAHAGLMGFRVVDGAPGIAPELAESYTISEDGTVYTFTLKKGLKWSDGADFVASQLVDSWKRAAGDTLGADYAYMFDVIEGFPNELNAVADDVAGTVTVKLNARTPYFIELCAFPAYYPVRTEIADEEGIWAVDPATYIGMGPFKMTKYAADNVIEFVKNEYFWDAANVVPAGINCYLSEDNVAILTAYENNTVQFIDAIDPTEFERLNATYPGELTFAPYIGTYYVLFNVYKDMSPEGMTLTVQQQSDVRFALGEMINREELVTYVTKGGQRAATGFFPDSLSDGVNANVRASDLYGAWYTGTNTPSEENEAYTEDQVHACKQLIELGYAYTGSIADGNIQFTNVPSIEFSFNNSGANAAIIQYVQGIWESFGITSTINQEAWATLQLKLKAGDAEVARMGWIADFNDCVNFLDIFLSNSGNNYPRLGRDVGTYTRFTDTTKDAGTGAYWGMSGDQTWTDAYDALIKEIKMTSDTVKRAELCAEAERILMLTGGAAPLYFYTRPNMLKPAVKDMFMMPTGEVIWTYALLEQ